jgi:hypothetical protein
MGERFASAKDTTQAGGYVKNRNILKPVARLSWLIEVVAGAGVEPTPWGDDPPPRSASTCMLYVFQRSR